MTNPTVTVRFNTWYGELFQLYQEKQYTQALEIAQREGEQYFPQHAPMIYHFRACMHTMLGEGAAAINTLQAALDAGLWYSDLYLDDTDFDGIREDAAFKALRTESEKRFAAAKAAAAPKLTTAVPQNVTGALPLVIGLHGNNSSGDRMGFRWTPAAEHGWLVGIAHSSQIAAPDAFVWNDTEKSESEIKAHFAALKAAHTLDPQRIVLSGFSMGGETAIRLALTGAIPTQGFLAIAFGGPLTGADDLSGWEAITSAAPDRSLRGYFVIGKADRGYEGQMRLIEHLRAAGFTIQVEEHDGMDHDFPADFAERLPEMLNWVVNG